MSYRHTWKAEEDDFLRLFYPDNGIVKTHNAFKSIYDPNASLRAVEHRIQFLGLVVTEKRKADLAKGSSDRMFAIHETYRKKVGVGTINSENGWIKTDDGWKRLGNILRIPKGYCAVHLDGNLLNNEPCNIAVIPLAISMAMTVNRFWSEHPEITRTGIMCCELEMQIKKSNAKTIPIK